jgi:hypothetical protein
MKINKIGELAFLVGVILAILVGLFLGSPSSVSYPMYMAVILVLLGIVVGLLNITQKETTAFLVAVIALLAAGSGGLGILPAVGSYLDAMLVNIALFVAPAAIIVALKTVVTLAKKK